MEGNMLHGQNDQENIYDAIWPHGAPKREIACPSCKRMNRLDVGKAALRLKKCRCGKCGVLMFRQKTDALLDLQANQYQHPLDKSSLRALHAIPGLPLILKRFMNEIGEKPMRYQVLASSVQCGPKQFSQLYDQLQETQRSLGLMQKTTLFLSQSPVLNASTFGAEEPVIVVHSALLDHLDDLGIRTVLGHELGHVHSEHSTYKLLATLILQGGAKLGGWSQLLTTPLRMGLQKWSRCAELTADRAGLLASRSLEGSIRVLMHMAGGYSEGVSRRTNMSIAPFVAQARTLKGAENDSWMDGLFASLVTLNRSHPFTAWRLLMLIEWVEYGNFLDILLASSVDPKQKTAEED
jgi:Zn-dependent protease with chaperone function